MWLSKTIRRTGSERVLADVAAVAGEDAHYFLYIDYPNLGKNYQYYGKCCKDMKKIPKQDSFALGFQYMSLWRFLFYLI